VITLYKIINDQYQDVKVFKTLDEAKRYINVLKEGAYSSETFYVVELKVVYFL
jgi:hypothetical protein